MSRRVNRNGEPWAATQLEDLAAGTEVLFFPQTYPVVGVNVAEDVTVLVKARVTTRDDRIWLIANDSWFLTWSRPALPRRLLGSR